jgi:hypothetical protein
MRQFCYALAFFMGLGAIAPAHAYMRCTPSSCIDTRSGYYTQSHCDGSGCRPLGGVVGQVGPNGYDSAYAYGGNRYGRYPRGYYGDRY